MHSALALGAIVLREAFGRHAPGLGAIADPVLELGLGDGEGAARPRAATGARRVPPSGSYSLVGAGFIRPLSARWRLKSSMEAKLNVPSFVSASIEPSAKIL